MSTMTNDHNCPNNLTIIVQNKLVTGCDLCLEDQIIISPESARSKREWQKKQYRADTLQPVPSQARDFVRHHGVEKSREWGYSDEEIRKLS